MPRGSAELKLLKSADQVLLFPRRGRDVTVLARLGRGRAAAHARKLRRPRTRLRRGGSAARPPSAAVHPFASFLHPRRCSPR